MEIREPRTAQELEAYYELRWRVLREPWTQARDSGKDEHESQAIHLTAWAGTELAGAGRVHMISSDQAQIRYMAVEPHHARRGIGGLILAGLEERARRIGARSIVLNARDTALGFHSKHGYRLLNQSSTLFESIVHWKMRKDV